MTRSLFLKWAVINGVFLTALVLAGLSYHGHVPVVAKAAIGAVLILYLGASGYAGRLTWCVDRSGYARIVYREKILPRALRDLHEAVEALPKLAMLGTVSGFLIALSGDTADVQQRVTGASTGLVATFVGIACMIALGLQVRLLERHAE